MQNQKREMEFPSFTCLYLKTFVFASPSEYASPINISLTQCVSIKFKTAIINYPKGITNRA